MYSVLRTAANVCRLVVVCCGIAYAHDNVQIPNSKEHCIEERRVTVVHPSQPVPLKNELCSADANASASVSVWYSTCCCFCKSCVRICELGGRLFTQSTAPPMGKELQISTQKA